MILRNGHLNSNEISIGQLLQISQPFRDAPSVPATSDFTNQKSSSFGVHVVQPGETLYSISRMHNISVSDIKEWNGLYSNELSIGQKLVFDNKEEVQNFSAEISKTPTGSSENNDLWNNQNDQESNSTNDAAIQEQNNNDDWWKNEFTTSYEEPQDDLSAAEDEIIAPSPLPVEEEMEEQPDETITVEEVAVQETPVAEKVESEQPVNKYSQYLIHIKKGDADLKAGNYQSAITSYEAAQALMPDRSYPQWRLKEANQKLQAQNTSIVSNTSSTTKKVAEETHQSYETAVPAKEKSASAKQPKSASTTVASSQSTVPPDAVTAKTHYAVLKTKPTDFGKNLAFLEEDTEVLIINSDTRLRNYYQVKTDKGTGWICGRNIKKTGDIKNFKRSRK